MCCNREEKMKVHNQKNSGKAITNPWLVCIVFLLLGCFNNFIQVSTSVINDQTNLMPLHNFQSDQGYIKGNL